MAKHDQVAAILGWLLILAAVITELAPLLGLVLLSGIAITVPLNGAVIVLQSWQYALIVGAFGALLIAVAGVKGGRK